MTSPENNHFFKLYLYIYIYIYTYFFWYRQIGGTYTDFFFPQAFAFKKSQQSRPSFGMAMSLSKRQLCCRPSKDMPQEGHMNRVDLKQESCSLWKIKRIEFLGILSDLDTYPMITNEL